MRVPALQGIIRRRILVNYRVDPDVIQRLIPVRFKPKLYEGHAIAGICLIRLEQVRPKSLPAMFGLHSENAAHRVAVTWNDERGELREGVFIPRRDTNSLLNHWVGGRLFPGEHQRARFTIREAREEIDFRMRSLDGKVAVELLGSTATELPKSSIFGSVAEASRFFAAGSLGYSPTRNPCRFDGMLLEIARWQVLPLAIRSVHSSFFANAAQFPPGSAEFDHALIMRDLTHSWYSAADLVA
ncbi:MAG: DUF2071 domain-containing protein [Pirellulales bacterium]